MLCKKGTTQNVELDIQFHTPNFDVKDMMETIAEECTVSGTLGFALRVSQMYGVASLSIRRERDGWRISVSRGAYLFQTLAVSLLGISLFFGIVMIFCRDDDLLYFNPGDKVVVAGTASSFVVEMVLLAQMFSGIQKMRNVVTCLKQLQKVHTELVCYSPRRSYERIERLVAIWTIISGHSVVVFIFCVEVANFPYAEINRQGIFSPKKQGEIILWHTLLIFLTYIKFLMTKTVILQIAIILTNVLSSFNHLNDCLTKISAKMYVGYTSKVHEEVNKMCHIYNCLFEIVQVLGDNYGIVLAPLSLYFLMNLVMAIYMFIFQLFIAVKRFNSPLTPLPWIAYYLIDMLIILEPCHRTYKQMNRTKQLVSQLMRYTHPTDHKLMSELELFYECLMRKEVIYAPLNTYELNRAFLLKIFGGIITYVVVVIQLQNN